MTIYQKAIKLRKICENNESCYVCDYCINCFSSNIIKDTPLDETIITVAKAIKEEKWNVK